jgi:hypothetical protein
MLTQMPGPRGGDGTRRLRLPLLRVLLLSAKEYEAKLLLLRHMLRHLLKPWFPMWLLLHRRSPKGKLGLRPLRL